VSQTSTLVNHTGSWKYIRPLYQDRVAPCNAGCPVGIDIEAYMNLLREGRVEEARDLLMRENPMPAVTGRVCHRPCEDQCNRRHFDEPVSIHGVERMLGDLELGAPLPDAPPRTRSEAVAVVGSGPAGLACAYHLARMGYDVTVYEEADEPGGMLRLGIPEYRLPRDVLDRQIDRIRAQGVLIFCGVRVGTDLCWSDLECDAVFIASGAHRSRGAGMKGEDTAGILSGLDFLKGVNAGARPDLGKRVVVVGGGNTAIDCARAARRLGAVSIVLYRRSRVEMPAIPQEIEEAKREGIEFVFLAAPVAARTVDGRLRGIECTRMRLGPPDDSGRRRPEPTDERPFSVVADTVLTAIGEISDLDYLRDDIAREAGGIVVNELGATNSPAVFAGGDAANAPRTVADALGAGKRAAIGIDLYLRRVAGELTRDDVATLRYGAVGNVSMTRWRDDDPVRRTSPVNEVVKLEDMNLSPFSHAWQHRDVHVAGEEPPSHFREVNRGLTYDAAIDEARRCLNCGVCNECELCLIFCPDFAISRRDEGGFDIDMNYCKGCGVCAAECPRGAMTMVREGL
jgi:2-oxoacid:acceptor oxidoreductase delta subunit (pyruvate/2-ketoisovalerate family)